MDDTVNRVVRGHYTAKRIAQDSTEDAILIINQLVLERCNSGDGRLNVEFLEDVLAKLRFHGKGLGAVAKMSVLLPVGYRGLISGLKLPDKDIRCLGIGKHRFFLYHSAIGVAILSYLYHQWQQFGSQNILSRASRKISGLLLGSCALGWVYISW